MKMRSPRRMVKEVGVGQARARTETMKSKAKSAKNSVREYQECRSENLTDRAQGRAGCKRDTRLFGGGHDWKDK
jgi:hypothetical protein